MINIQNNVALSFGGTKAMKLRKVMKNILATIITAFVMFVAVEGHALAYKNAGQRNGLFAHQHSTRSEFAQLQAQNQVKILPRAIILAENPNNVISPTRAVQAAMGTAPRGKVLSIRFNKRKRGYVIRIKVPGGLLKLLVDGRTSGVRVLPN